MTSEKRGNRIPRILNKAHRLARKLTGDLNHGDLLDVAIRPNTPNRFIRISTRDQGNFRPPSESPFETIPYPGAERLSNNNRQPQIPVVNDVFQQAPIQPESSPPLVPFGFVSPEANTVSEGVGKPSSGQSHGSEGVNGAIIASNGSYFTAEDEHDKLEQALSSSTRSGAMSPSSKTWGATLYLKGMDIDECKEVKSQLEKTAKEQAVTVDQPDYLTVPNLNPAIQKRLQRCVFQMYCATVQCTICLSSLSSSGEPCLYSVKASTGIGASDPKLIFNVNIPEFKDINGDDEQIEEDELSVACLPCGHKFCKSCLTHLITHKAEAQHGGVDLAPLKMRIRCPLCRRKVKVTSVSYFTV